MITELSRCATLTVVVSALWILSLPCTAYPVTDQSKPEKLTHGYDWRFTGSLGKGRFPGDDNFVSERKVPASIQESQTAIEISAGYKISDAIWINSGLRRYSREKLSYCDQYNDDDCLNISSGLTSAWAGVGYHFYPIIKDFQFEIGLHLGLVSNQLESDLGSSSSLNSMTKLTLAVPYRERWLIQYSADVSEYEDINSKQMNFTTQLISLSYLY